MYSPKIEERFIPILYRIAKEKKIPMTRVVNRIIQDYLANHISKRLTERRLNGKETIKAMAQSS
jgi:hypothetical protein